MNHPLVVSEIAALRSYLAPERNGKIGFVATMGYLHDGHKSLMNRAREECDVVVLSIFVNPLQFGPKEDFDKYPRSLAEDLKIAGQAGVDVVFTPDPSVMYPKPTLTTVSVRQITDSLCGASRPGHFDGVATVVAKLFNIIQPDRAYFGMKDAQQVAVIEQMVFDLNMPLEIVPCPTVRESDGLAMSSRNVYLSPDERRQALVLSESLRKAEDWITGGLSDPTELERRIGSHIRTAPLADIDYIEIREYPAMQRPETLSGKRILIALAVKFGNTRLIDNLLISVPDNKPKKERQSCSAQ